MRSRCGSRARTALPEVENARKIRPFTLNLSGKEVIRETTKAFRNASSVLKAGAEHEYPFGARGKFQQFDPRTGSGWLRGMHRSVSPEGAFVLKDRETLER